MNLTRALVVLDVETTGTDPMTDRIVQFGAVRIEPGGSQECLNMLVNPGCKIPAEATAIHGITDAQVEMRPKFPDLAHLVVGFLADADFAGYRLRSLDLPIVDQELRRCGSKLPTGAEIIDVYGIWAKALPRTLKDAVRFFCGREMPDAHDALADAQATLDVLHGQLAAFPQFEGMSAAALAILSNMGDRVYADLAGKLYKDADGDLRYSFGKHRDTKVRDETGFGHWMLGKDFPGNTLDVLYAELKRLEGRGRGELPFEEAKDIPF
jgi:DNA polymerase-3 subunit epsilon